MKDSIDRIAVALERIAVALEKANEPVVVKQDWPESWSWPSNMVYGPGLIDADNGLPKSDIHVWTGPTAEDDCDTIETCQIRFDKVKNYGKFPEDEEGEQ